MKQCVSLWREGKGRAGTPLPAAGHWQSKHRPATVVRRAGDCPPYHPKRTLCQRKDFPVLRRFLWVSAIRGRTVFGGRFKVEALALWSAAACRRFVPRNSHPVPKRDRASRTPNRHRSTVKAPLAHEIKHLTRPFQRVGYTVKASVPEFGITIALVAEELSPSPSNLGRRSSQNSTLQNNFAVKSSDHSWLLRRNVRFSGGVFAKRYRRKRSWNFDRMNRMNRMQKGILLSDSVLNPVNPVHPVQTSFAFRSSRFPGGRCCRAAHRRRAPTLQPRLLFHYRRFLLFRDVALARVGKRPFDFKPGCGFSHKGTQRTQRNWRGKHRGLCALSSRCRSS